MFVVTIGFGGFVLVHFAPLNSSQMASQTLPKSPPHLFNTEINELLSYQGATENKNEKPYTNYSIVWVPTSGFCSELLGFFFDRLD